MRGITPDKTVFFDFDSTLADTEPYHIYAWDTVLNPFGIHIDDWESYCGNSDLFVFSTLKEQYHLDMDIPTTIDAKLRIFKEQAIQAGLQPYPDIAGLIQTLPNRKFVLTKQRYEIVSFFLKKWGLDRYFEDIISLEYSPISKADKIIEMGFTPQNCVLLDDVLHNVEEADEKGIQAIWVVNGKVKGDYV